MYPEATHCARSQLAEAFAYIEKRNLELRSPALLRRSVDPSKVTMDELFDDFLAAQQHEPTNQEYEWNLNKNLRPYFGKMLACQLTVEHCQAYRAFRRTQIRVDDARAKLEEYHQRQGLPNQTDEVAALKAKIAALEARVAPVEHSAGGARARKSGLVLVRGKKA